MHCNASSSVSTVDSKLTQLQLNPRAVPLQFQNWINLRANQSLQEGGNWSQYFGFYSRYLFTPAFYYNSGHKCFESIVFLHYYSTEIPLKFHKHSTLNPTIRIRNSCTPCPAQKIRVANEKNYRKSAGVKITGFLVLLQIFKKWKKNTYFLGKRRI